MQSLIDTDVYWGEFAEDQMDLILGLCSQGRFEDAKRAIGELKRTDFVFGKARSDFLYMAPLTKDSVCLDIGCGLGVHTFNLAPLVKEVHSCDLSKKRAQFVDYRKKMENISNVTAYHSDIDHLPFPENTFDFIMMNGVVEWLGTQNKHENPRDDQIEGLRKANAMLKPGGVLYIGIENRFAATYLRNARDHNRLKYTTFMPRFLANAVTKRKLGYPYRTYTYGKRGYEKLLLDSGFDPKESEFYVAHQGYNYPQYLIPVRDKAAMRFFLSLFGNGKGMKAAALRMAMAIPGFLSLAPHAFYSFAIYAAKRHD